MVLHRAALSSRRTSALTTSALLAGLVLSGCNGSQKTSVHKPLDHVSKDAEAVFEVADLGSLMKLRQLATRFPQVASEQQLSELQSHFSTVFGFDPTTKEGLASAGLPTKGGLAIEVAGGGNAAVWIFPVKDAKKLQMLLEKQMKDQLSIVQVAKAKEGQVDLNVFQTQFGEQTAVKAATAYKHGLAFLGMGSDAKALVAKAVSLKAEQNITKSPEFASLAKELPQDYTLRMISPKGGKAVSSALQNAPINPKAIGGLDKINGAAWALKVDGKGAKVVGRIRLPQDVRALIEKLFNSKEAVGTGVPTLNIKEALLYAQVAGDMDALLAFLAPPGSPARGKIDVLAKRIQADLGVDIYKEIFPLSTGHMAMAIGVGDLSKVDFKTLVGNPASVAWTGIGFGIKEPKKLKELETRMAPKLAERGITSKLRKAGKAEIRSYSFTRGKATASLMETMAAPKAMIFANEPVVMDRSAANASPQDLLKNKGGAVVEVRFKQASRSLARFNYATLPIMFRSIIAKTMDTIKMLDMAQMHVYPQKDGLAVDVKVTWADLSAKK